jgi:hypothetical protein
MSMAAYPEEPVTVVPATNRPPVKHPGPRSATRASMAGRSLGADSATECHYERACEMPANDGASLSHPGARRFESGQLHNYRLHGHHICC